MSISNYLKEAVSTKDLNLIREELRSKIPLDPTLSKGYLESYEFCIKNGITGIYEIDDQRELPYEDSADSFEFIVGMIQTNFSKEKIERLKSIGMKVYGTNNTSTTENSSKSNEEGRRIISRPHIAGHSQEGSSSNNTRYTSKPREKASSDKESGGPSTGTILLVAAAVAAVAIGVTILVKKF